MVPPFNLHCTFIYIFYVFSNRLLLQGPEVPERQLRRVHRQVGWGHGEGVTGLLQVHADRQDLGWQRLRNSRGPSHLCQVAVRHPWEEGPVAVPHHELRKQSLSCYAGKKISGPIGSGIWIANSRNVRIANFYLFVYTSVTITSHSEDNKH